MNLIKADQKQLSFQMDEREKEALLEVLKLYPLIPASYPKLSRAGTRPEDQELLEEALSAQRAENQRLLKKLLSAKTRFRSNQRGVRFTLKVSDAEWLLQVLNDVRVGSWLLLGSPEGPAEIFAALNDQTGRHFWSMEVAGHFQMELLHAMESIKN